MRPIGARAAFASDIFSYVTGNHSLKFGGDVQRIKSTFIDLSDASGTFDFDSAGDFLAGIPSRFRQNFETSSTQTTLTLVSCAR